MKMMDESRPLFLYSANKKVYPPINDKNRRKGSAILLLSPSIEVSCQLINLPYVVDNNNLFRSFYIDRNVMAYIDSTPEEYLDFDEQEEEALSESMVSSMWSKVKFKFDEDTSTMDMRYLNRIYTNKIASDYVNTLGIRRIPDKISVFVHPSLKDLRENYSGKQDSESIFYFVKTGEIHVISYRAYDKDIMYGPYDLYLACALICCLCLSYNEDMNIKVANAIAVKLSGLNDWMNDNDASVNIGSCNKILDVINRMVDAEHSYKSVSKYIRTNDYRILTKFIVNNTRFAKEINRLLDESTLTYSERERLLPSQFGVPNKRKYPMPDEEHVRLAIRLFNSCDPDDEEELAEAIIARIKKFGITDVKVSASNRFRKYYEKSKIYKDTVSKNTVKESTDIDDSNNYDDIAKICNNIDKCDLRRITFHDTYKNSPYVVKRIIHRIDGNPVGFLDLYQYPSKPEIAQIVLAVDKNYREMGIARSMVKELINSDINKSNGINIYYWTAHKDNDASKYLALSSGFTDTGKCDNYGRQIFIKSMKDSENIWKEIPDEMKPGYSESFASTDTSFVTESMALFTEGDESRYSSKLKKYLYNERLRNNRGVIEYYDKVKENSKIDRTYLKLKMYKSMNLYVDLSYYHALFLKNNKMKMDNAVNFYFDFLNRLINNKEINEAYKKQTIFIPVDAGVWPLQPTSEIYDFRKNINPISIITRLVRTNPGALKKAWGNKNIFFVGTRGYFTVDFNKFDMKQFNRFKINIDKLMSSKDLIEDDFELDNDTSTDMANVITVADSIERVADTKIDDVSGIVTSKENIGIPHLRIRKEPINIDKSLISKNNGIVLINIDPDGPDGYDKSNKSILSNTSGIVTYCMPDV